MYPFLEVLYKPKAFYGTLHGNQYFKYQNPIYFISSIPVLADREKFFWKNVVLQRKV